MLSWFSSVTIIGNLMGAPLGGLLLTLLSNEAPPQLTHFHMIYGVVAACGMAALLLALWFLSAETHPLRGPTSEPFRKYSVNFERPSVRF